MSSDICKKNINPKISKFDANYAGLTNVQKCLSILSFLKAEKFYNYFIDR